MKKLTVALAVLFLTTSVGMAKEPDRICFHNSLTKEQIVNQLSPAERNSINAMLKNLEQMKPAPAGVKEQFIASVMAAYGTKYVMVHHGGCAGLPWRDNQPQCVWAKVTPILPGGDAVEKAMADKGLSVGSYCYEPSGAVKGWAEMEKALVKIGEGLMDAILNAGCAMAEAAVDVASAGVAAVSNPFIEAGCITATQAANAGIEAANAGADADAWGFWYHDATKPAAGDHDPLSNLSPAETGLYKSAHMIYSTGKDGKSQVNFVLPLGSDGWSKKK